MLKCALVSTVHINTHLGSYFGCRLKPKFGKCYFFIL